MAATTRTRFDELTEQRMRDYYRTVSEKDRRRFAALEAQQFGYGGQAYMADLLGCSISSAAQDAPSPAASPNSNNSQTATRVPDGFVGPVQVAPKN